MASIGGGRIVHAATPLARKPLLSSRRRASVMITLLLALGAVSCAPPPRIVLIPAQLEQTASERNHTDGDAYVFVDSGAVSTQVKFHGVRRWSVVVAAHAEAAADGAWPQLKVELDGMPTRTIVVADRRSIPYWFNFASEPGFAQLKLSLVNASPNAAPTLIIDRIQLVPL